MRTCQLEVVRHARSCALLLIAGVAAGCSKGSSGDGRDASVGMVDGMTGGADAPVDAVPLTCYDFSLDPDVPLALDGTFGASSPTWSRPHDEPPLCPATALLPTTAALVPYVAYAFCNNTGAAHTFDFEMLSADGPANEPPLDDPYMILYQGQGIPADARGCLAINDDIEGALDTKDSEILGVEVPPGGAITMVLTTYTFDPGDATGTGYYIGVVTSAD